MHKRTSCTLCVVKLLKPPEVQGSRGCMTSYIAVRTRFDADMADNVEASILQVIGQETIQLHHVARWLVCSSSLNTTVTKLIELL
jgi:hypothetical protein